MASTASLPELISRARIRARRAAVLPVELGLGSWLLLLLMFASFGPGFRLDVAYALASGAIILGVLGTSRADRALSALHRHATGGIHVPGVAGLVLSLSAAILGATSAGILSLVVFPPILLLAASIGIVLLILRVGIPACTGCGRRTGRPSVMTRHGDWLCSRCTRSVAGAIP
ncbi:MAG TPA: hypothetical protein VJ400_00935 [Thermoplasmata archaeon]|nr:hypothetical protein [Thermoplasmata archaeon]